MGEREVIRCNGCDLNQFMAADRKCRRCRKLLRLEASATAVQVTQEEADLPKQEKIIVVGNVSGAIGAAIKICRLARGLSQRNLAALMEVPRTYVSKVEGDHAVPTIESIAKFSKGLDLRPAFIIMLAEGLADEVSQQRADVLRPAAMVEGHRGRAREAEASP